MYRTLTLFIITAICLFAQLSVISHSMTWDKTLILNGELWRILTGNLTHTNFPHLAMNVAALWLMGVIFKTGSKQLIFSVTIISVMVGCGLLFSDLERYVGLSGTLHGIFVYFAILEALAGRRTSWLLVAGIVLKVAWEQFSGASPATEALINAPVATQAHAIGLISGFGLAYLIRKCRKQ